MSSKSKKSYLHSKRPLKKPKTTKDPHPKAIDMTKVPQSVLAEGYHKLQEEDVPEYLKCPICKELYVAPEVFVGCGHTVCKICTTTKTSHVSTSKQCPVCKTFAAKTVTNFALKDMLEQQYTNHSQKRNEELEKMQKLSKKLEDYPHCERFRVLSAAFEDYMNEVKLASLDEVHQFLGGKDLKPQPSVDEMNYLIATRVLTNPAYRTIGHYILVWPYRNIESYLSWLEANKTSKNLKWSPLVIMAISNSPPLAYDIYKRLATMLKLEIGPQLSVEDWKSKAPTWLQDVPVEGVKHDVLKNYCVGCGTFHAGMPDDLSSDYDEDEESSEDDYWF